MAWIVGADKFGAGIVFVAVGLGVFVADGDGVFVDVGEGVFVSGGGYGSVVGVFVAVGGGTVVVTVGPCLKPRI